MTKNDRAQFVHTLAGMAGHYSQEITAADLDLWWATMIDWRIDDFKAAAAILLRRCKFMPKASDFEYLRRATVPTAAQAWAKVLQHLQGAYREGGLDEFSDAAVESLGGYRALAMAPASSLDFRRREFVEAYEDKIDAHARAGLLPAFNPAKLPRP